MLRSPGGRDARHTTPLPDNKRNTSIQGSKGSTPPISEAPRGPDNAARFERAAPASSNALQESAYRLHALVKRSSPQKVARSPIRFNKTEPLPSIGKPLQSPRRAAAGPAAGGVSKAPPSPRRSPLRGTMRDIVTATPQTRNVVERMIAYARHAASQEDPDMVQRDRQSFVSRLADRPNERSGAASVSSVAASTAASTTATASTAANTDAIRQSPALNASPAVAAQSTGAFPIMSNLSVHANLRRQQQASQTAPIHQGRAHEDNDARFSRPSWGPPRAAETGPIDTRRSAQPSRDSILGEGSQTDQLIVELNAPSPPPANTAPLVASSSSRPSFAQRGGPYDRSYDRSYDRAPAPPGAQNNNINAYSGRRIPTSHDSSVSATPSTPQRRTQRTHTSGSPAPPVPEARLPQPAPSRAYRSSAAAAGGAPPRPAPAPPPPPPPPPPWDKQRWRVFIQAVHESFGPSPVSESEATAVLDELVHRLPPEMRDISVQEMVYRLHAWARSRRAARR